VGLSGSCCCRFVIVSSWIGRLPGGAGAHASGGVRRDAAHVHLGNGQLQTTLVLAPGPHHQCLQAGDRLHKALPISDELDLTVSA
jgi:hypothetical protein